MKAYSVRTVVLGLCLLSAALFLGRWFLTSGLGSGPVSPFAGLEPDEQILIRFLLLLPLGGLVVSAIRALIGVPTFGSFTPVLLGLAFLNPGTLVWSLVLFVTAVLVGGKLRGALDRLQLLQVSRFAMLLTLIIMFLVGLVVVTGRVGLPAAPSIAFFPLAILTHTAERFWTLETESGRGSAVRGLLGTLGVAVCVSLALSPAVVHHVLFWCPEGLGLVLAGLILLGRYNGYRLLELYRFRELLGQKEEDTFRPVLHGYFADDTEEAADRWEDAQPS
jgi:hypothetical protein